MAAFQISHFQIKSLLFVRRDLKAICMLSRLPRRRLRSHNPIVANEGKHRDGDGGGGQRAETSSGSRLSGSCLRLACDVALHFALLLYSVGVTTFSPSPISFQLFFLNRDIHSFIHHLKYRGRTTIQLLLIPNGIARD